MQLKYFVLLHLLGNIRKGCSIIVIWAEGTLKWQKAKMLGRKNIAHKIAKRGKGRNTKLETTLH